MSRTAFSARQVYHIAPLGSLIRFYDGIPEPPGRHGQERPERSKANGTGRLMRKTPASDLTAPGFILHVGGLGGGPTVVRSAPSRCRPTFVSPFSASPHAIRPSCFATNAAASPRSSISRGRDLAQCVSGSRARIVPADGPIPRVFTCLNDVDHGWLIVSRADLDEVGLSPADFSTWSYFCGDCFALDEYGDMPKFLERLYKRGITYRLYDRGTKGDAHVRQYWFRNERPAGRAAGA